MTLTEMRKTKDYTDAMQKIRNYSKSFKFTIDFSKIPAKKANALQIILMDACRKGLLESIEIGLDINGNYVNETYIRI